MTIELQYLLWAVALAFVQMLISVAAASAQVGLVKLSYNRDDMPELTGWAGRARRAYFNMLEALPLFAALVLVAHALGVSNAMTVLGAQLFFWGRAAHMLVYYAGVPFLRTGVWLVSAAGLILIFLQLV